MLDYAFIKILESLNRDELKQFRRFLLSPYFNRSKKVIKLFDNLTKHHPNYDITSLTKESLHKKVSPDLEYNDVTMRRLLYDLQNLAERFIKQRNFESKQIESNTFLIEDLVKRGAEKMLNKNYKNTVNKIDNAVSLNSDLFFSRFRIECERFYFGMIHNSINKKSFVNTEADRLVRGLTSLISYFMLEAIKHSETLLEYSRTFNVKKNEELLSSFLDLFDFSKLLDFMRKNSQYGSYILEPYINALQAFVYFNDDSYYFNFKKSLFTNRHKLSLSDNNFLFIKLTGYCVTKIMNSTQIHPVYDSELFENYKMVVDEKFYETEANKFFPIDLFRNIIIQSTRMQELTWLEDFILNYGIQLHPERRDEVINYSYAHLYFERNVYDTSLDYLSRIKMDEFSYALDAKALYLKNYYEQEDYDTAYSYAKSFLKYLNESQLISGSKKEANLNFVKFVIKLINYHSGRSKTNLNSLSLQVKKQKNLSNRFWLANKTQFLENSQQKTAI